MKLLGLSGSTRAASSNTALLRWLASVAGPDVQFDVYSGLAELPIFSTDLEGPATPRSVRSFADKVAAADGIIISSPEYVRAIPGGLKNAIDWLVSREELIAKPLFMAHASHRGDDMLKSLRIVLGTVSSCFDESVFLRLPLSGMTTQAIDMHLAERETQQQGRVFLEKVSSAVIAPDE